MSESDNMLSFKIQNNSDEDEMAEIVIPSEAIVGDSRYAGVPEDRKIKIVNSDALFSDDEALEELSGALQLPDGLVSSMDKKCLLRNIEAARDVINESTARIMQVVAITENVKTGLISVIVEPADGDSLNGQGRSFIDADKNGELPDYSLIAGFDGSRSCYGEMFEFHFEELWECREGSILDDLYICALPDDNEDGSEVLLESYENGKKYWDSLGIPSDGSGWEEFILPNGGCIIPFVPTDVIGVYEARVPGDRVIKFDFRGAKPHVYWA